MLDSSLGKQVSKLRFEDRPFFWSLDRYHKAIETGVLTELDKVELIFGEIIEKMAVGEDHADVLGEIADYLTELVGKKDYKFRQQNPVTLPNHSEPEPDLAIVTRKPYNKKTGHPKPTDIRLLIEISDSTLSDDRNRKQRAYAAADIQEYWIVNIPGRQVEVHLSPEVKKQEYLKVSKYPEGQIFNSPFCGEVAVSNLLPEELEEE